MQCKYWQGNSQVIKLLFKMVHLPHSSFLVKLTNILGIMPFFNYDVTKVAHEKYYKGYCIFLSIIYWICYMCKFKLDFALIHKKSVTTTVLDEISQLTLILSVIIPILSAGFWNFNNWKIFLKRTKGTCHNISFCLKKSILVFSRCCGVV